MGAVDSETFKEFAREVTSYIRTTQPLLEKAAAQQKDIRAYQEKCAHVVDTLVAKGRLPLAEAVPLYHELMASPVKAASLLVQMADQVGPVSLGGPSDLKDHDDRDPIEKFVMDHS